MPSAGVRQETDSVWKPRASGLFVLTPPFAVLCLPAPEALAGLAYQGILSDALNKLRLTPAVIRGHAGSYETQEVQHGDRNRGGRDDRSEASVLASYVGSVERQRAQRK